MPDARTSRPVGFTLVELLVVIAIMGIIIALILVAASDGVRRAEERQTQALIAKLNTALDDRVDALLASTPPINQTHRYLGALTENVSDSNYLNTIPNSDGRRAQVIALLDYMKAELPDVFFLNPSAFFDAVNGKGYPLNFAGAPYPLDGSGFDAFALPLGNRNPGGPVTPSVPGTTPPTPPIPTPGFDLGSGYNDQGVAYPVGVTPPRNW